MIYALIRFGMVDIMCVDADDTNQRKQGISKMNAERKAIEKKYSKAIASLKVAKTQEEFDAAEATLNTMRPMVIDMEKKHPTAAEQKRAANKLHLREIGMDC